MYGDNADLDAYFDYMKRSGLNAPSAALPQQVAQNQSPPGQKQPQQSPQSTDISPPPYPAPPNLRDMPQAPAAPQDNPFAVFKDPAIVLAGLGSLFTRHSLTTAFNSAAGAMEGYRTGQQQVFEDKKQAFDEAIKAATEQNKVELDKYNDAWNRRNQEVKDKFAALYAQAAGNNDTTLMAALKSGNSDIIEKIITAREAAQTKLTEAVQLAQIKNQFAQGDPVAAHNLAQSIADGKQPPLTGYALRTPWGQQVMGEVMQINPDYDAANWYGHKSATTVAQTADVKADATALNKLVAQRSAVTAFEQTAVKNGKVLLDLADKVDQTGVPIFERWLRAGRQATGDPLVAQFNTQMQLFRNEAAKILTNPNLTGVLSDSARHEIESFLQGGSSAKQLHAVIGLLEGDFSRRTDAIDEQIGVLRDRIKGGTGVEPNAGRQQGPVQVQTPADAQALPPGTHYVTPDGREMIR